MRTHTYEFSISKETIAAIKNDNPNVRKLIAKDLLARDTKLSSVATHYCKDDRGTPSDCSLEIEANLIELADDLTGIIVILFEEFVDNGCADLHKRYDRQVTVKFRISLAHGTLTLIDVPDTSAENYFNEMQTGELSD